MHRVARKFTRGSCPRRTVIQNLPRFRKGVVMCPLHPAHGIAEPTFLRIHVAHNEGWHPGHPPLYIHELPRLRHTDRLRQSPEVFAADIVVRLHVGVDHSQGPLGATLGEFDTEPALRHEGVDSGVIQKGIEPCLTELPISGAPGDSETGTENGGNVSFTGGPEEGPAVSGKDGGPRGVTAPDFLEGDDVTTCDDPTNDFLDGRICPRKTVGIICAYCERVHYFPHVLCFSGQNDGLRGGADAGVYVSHGGASADWGGCDGG